MSQELIDEIRSAAGKPAGLVRFGFPPSVGTLFVGRILAECIARYPSVKLHLVENVSPTVREGLINGSLDMAIMSCKASHNDLRVIPLFHEQLWLFASRELWSLKDNPVPLSRLEKLPVIMASFLLKHLEPKVPLQVIAAIDALPLAREALFARAGYGIFPYSALSRELSHKELKGAPIEGLTVSRGLFFRKNRMFSNAMRLLQDLIEQQVTTIKKERSKIFLGIDGDDYIV
ncbi:DNA-binding transcriptional LysR family regulator [Bradyrhizobium sp. USDA 4449]